VLYAPCEAREDSLFHDVSITRDGIHKGSVKENPLYIWIVDEHLYCASGFDRDTGRIAECPKVGEAVVVNTAIGIGVKLIDEVLEHREVFAIFARFPRRDDVAADAGRDRGRSKH
jgi:hypothetical protein